ncbi:MAG: hypothetical protein GX070_00220 [Alcaligenaceae bacterium]|nr:hypothetical protein [Alcaligenaceae bacterium]
MELQSTLIRSLEHGIEIQCDVENLSLNIYFILGDTDFEEITRFIPASRFEQGNDIHVGSLNESQDLEDEIESILANMNTEDTVVFFCADENSYHTGLDFLNYQGSRDFIQPN